MRLTDEKLREMLRQQTARSTPRQSECLGEDQFMRAAAGEMNSEERRAVARHLITCTDCTEEYQLLRSLKPLSEEMQAALKPRVDTPVSADRPLLRMVERLPASRYPRPHFTPSVWRSRSGLAVAASLLISLGLGGWLLFTRHESSRQIARLNEQLMERERMLASAQESLDQTRSRPEEIARPAAGEKTPESPGKGQALIKREVATPYGAPAPTVSPQLDVPIIDLDPSEATRGDPKKSPARIEIPRTANLITLILNFSHREHSRYAVEVFDHLGKRVWRGEQSKKAETRSVNVTLSRDFVPAGLFEIKLYGLDGTTELIAAYAVQIEK